MNSKIYKKEKLKMVNNKIYGVEKRTRLYAWHYEKVRNGEREHFLYVSKYDIILVRYINHKKYYFLPKFRSFLRVL